MKMLDASWTIDIFRMARSRRDPTVQRLAELTYDNQIIHAPLAQGTEDVCPNLRKRLLSVAKQMDKVVPMIAGRKFPAGGEIAELHGRSQSRV